MDIAVLSVIKRFRSNRVSKVSLKQDVGGAANSGGDFGLQASPSVYNTSARSRRASSFCSPPPHYKSRDDLAVVADDKKTVVSLYDV